ncbi:hypothetical protein L7F22_017607 [Adiantum nelumboides]|nr:hypothetical protein [Adiantum nelumboides]
MDEPVLALVDHGSEIILMLKSLHQKGRWPIDADYGWRIQAANMLPGDLYGACANVKGWYYQQQKGLTHRRSPSPWKRYTVCPHFCSGESFVSPQLSQVNAPPHTRVAEDAGARPLTSSCRSRFGLTSSSWTHQRSSRIQSAKKTYSSFDDLLSNTETALLVDFYATWCGPCQFMVPILDDVGRALKDKLRIVKIDSEKYPTIASRYGVQALPTMILFQNGEPIDRLEGALSAPDLIKRIEGVLSVTSSAK